MFFFMVSIFGCTTIIGKSIYRLIIEKEINELFSFSEKDEILLRFYSNTNVDNARAKVLILVK